jgi:repressor LexA
MATRTQQKIFEFIKKYISQNSHSPSYTEIAEGIGISDRSKSLVSRYVHALVKEGLLELQSGQYRQIRLKDSLKPNLPLLGCIAAGRPIEALSANEQLNLIDLLENNNQQERYALQVKGDSMIDEGIWDGDIILCEPRASAKKWRNSSGVN